MSQSGTNRFEFEDEESIESGGPGNPEGTDYLYDESPGEGLLDEVYLDEPDTTYKNRQRFRRIITASLLLLVLLVGGVVVYLKFFRSPGDGPAANRGPIKMHEGRLDDLKDRPYLPEGNFSTELNRAIGFYKANNFEQAKRAFENFLTVSEDPREKAVALVYLGLMAFNQEKYTVARLHFSRAEQWDSKSVAVLVNRAILERKLKNGAAAKDYARRAQELAPRDHRVSRLLGNIQSDNENSAGAIDSYRKAIESSPGDAYNYYNLGLALLKERNDEEAIVNFLKAADNGTGEVVVQAYNRVAQIYFRQERFELAVDYQKKAIQIAPAEAKYHYNLGVIYLRMKRNKEALASFQAALRVKSNDARIYRGLSYAFGELKQNNLAIQSLKDALYLNPDDISSLFLLGDLYYKEQDLLKSAEVFQKIVNITPGGANSQEALNKLGAVYVDLERYDDAVAAFNKLLSMNNRSGRGWYGLGVAYMRVGKADLAIGAWRKALDGGNVAGDPGESGAGNQRPPLSRDEERMIRNEMASLYRRRGAFNEALNQYRLILDSNRRTPVKTEDPRIHLEMGRTFLRMKAYPDAIKSLQTVTASRSANSLQRKDAFVLLARAHGASDRPEDREMARENANKAARLAPQDYDARYEQAATFLKTGSLTDRDRAIEILRALTGSDLNEQNASRAYNLLGLAYYKNGEYLKAKNSFEYAVQLNPSNKTAYDNLRLAGTALENDRGLR